jgi:hypothetical protein
MVVNRMWKAVDNRRKRMFERDLNNCIEKAYVIVDKHAKLRRMSSFLDRGAL